MTTYSKYVLDDGTILELRTNVGAAPKAQKDGRDIPYTYFLELRDKHLDKRLAEEKNWYRRVVEWNNKRQVEISWFFIGMFLSSLPEMLMRGEYGWALLDVVFIITNYILYYYSSERQK